MRSELWSRLLAVRYRSDLDTKFHGYPSTTFLGNSHRIKPRTVVLWGVPKVTKEGGARRFIERAPSKKARASTPNASLSDPAK